MTRLTESQMREVLTVTSEMDTSRTWSRHDQIGVGVTRCPPGEDGQPLRCNMGYVERRDSAREQAWREAS